MPNFWGMVDQDDHIGGTGVGNYRIFICNLHYSLKKGVQQFYKFVLKCRVRYTDTAVICDFPQIC